MVKDSPSLAPARLWQKTYRVSIVNDDGTATTFHLIPRDPSAQVASIDATVSDQTGYMTHIHFTNTNGSQVDTEQTYAMMGRRAVVVSTSGTTQGSGYKADVTTTLSNYQFNVPIPPSAFAQQH
jgi:outer membrane lipoprotein-sorting protein